ncbi:hypothetical protein QE416_003203 [Microbacterium sp. SORGH_AS 421]|nr:hypothetical protein [Microbacterium sp. SORGH_AS_0421]
MPTGYTPFPFVSAAMGAALVSPLLIAANLLLH